jgi:hypothetical protein
MFHPSCACLTILFVNVSCPFPIPCCFPFQHVCSWMQFCIPFLVTGPVLCLCHPLIFNSFVHHMNHLMVCMFSLLKAVQTCLTSFQMIPSLLVVVTIITLQFGRHLLYVRPVPVDVQVGIILMNSLNLIHRHHVTWNNLELLPLNDPFIIRNCIVQRNRNSNEFFV